MIKAFLFGGPFNGAWHDVYEDQNIVDVSRDIEVSFVGNEHVDPIQAVQYERYIKRDFTFRKEFYRNKMTGSATYSEMEDLNIYFHSSIPVETIETVGRVIGMALNASWSRVHNEIY